MSLYYKFDYIDYVLTVYEECLSINDIRNTNKLERYYHLELLKNAKPSHTVTIQYCLIKKKINDCIYFHFRMLSEKQKYKCQTIIYKEKF